MKAALNGLVTFSVLTLLWAAYVALSGIEPFILPGPLQVIETLIARFGMIMGHLGHTALEIVLGILIGTAVGCASALLVVPPVNSCLLACSRRCGKNQSCIQCHTRGDGCRFEGQI